MTMKTHTKYRYKTINLKTVSYDVTPDLPPHDNGSKRGIKFSLPGQNNTDGTNDNQRDKRSSIVSIDEKGYQTADDDDRSTIGRNGIKINLVSL